MVTVYPAPTCTAVLHADAKVSNQPERDECASETVGQKVVALDAMWRYLDVIKL